MDVPSSFMLTATIWVLDMNLIVRQLDILGHELRAQLLDVWNAPKHPRHADDANINPQ
jgi:hypothetical protein